MILGLSAYTWEAPYGYNADGSKIAPYGVDIYGRPRTGLPGIPESNPDPNYVAEEDFTAGTGKVIRNRVEPLPGTLERMALLTPEQWRYGTAPSTVETLAASGQAPATGFDISAYLQQLIQGLTPTPTAGTASSFDLSGFVSDNKWLLIGGAAVVVFLMFGRKK